VFFAKLGSWFPPRRRQGAVRPVEEKDPGKRGDSEGSGDGDGGRRRRKRDRCDCEQKSGEEREQQEEEANRIFVSDFASSLCILH
jgi:hypothetical protein